MQGVQQARQRGQYLLHHSQRLGAPVLGVVFTGEELSKRQRQILESGMATSGRTGAVVPDDDHVGDDDQADAEDVAPATPELHPS